MRSSQEAELAMLGAPIRRAFVTAPPEDVAERHIAAILAEAERVVAEAPERPAVATTRRRFDRRALGLRMAAAVGAAFIATAGLAVAGVRPPEPFSDLYEAIGFDVPGSDRGDESTQADDRDKGARKHDHKDEEHPAAVGGGSAEPGGGGSGEASAGHHGKRRGQQPEHPSEEGQETASQAQSGNTPPPEPGRSEDHPSPQGRGPRGTGPPGQSHSGGASSGSQGQGTPPSEPQADAPGQQGGSSQSQGGGNPHGVAPGAAVSETQQGHGSAKEPKPDD